MGWVEKSLRGDLLLFFTGRYHCSRYDVWFGDCGTDKKMRGQDAKIFTPSDQNEQDMSTTEGQLDGFGDGVREAEGWCIYWKMELPGRMKRLRPQRRFMDGVQKVVATKDATDWGTRRTWRKISIFWKTKKSDAKLRMEICCVTAAKMKTQPTTKWLKWNRTGQQNRIQQNKINL